MQNRSLISWLRMNGLDPIVLILWLGVIVPQTVIALSLKGDWSSGLGAQSMGLYPWMDTAIAVLIWSTPVPVYGTILMFYAVRVFEGRALSELTERERRVPWLIARDITLPITPIWWFSTVASYGLGLIGLFGSRPSWLIGYMACLTLSMFAAFCVIVHNARGAGLPLHGGPPDLSASRS